MFRPLVAAAAVALAVASAGAQVKPEKKQGPAGPMIGLSLIHI